ncbi:MAG: hypothetical protein ACI8R1_002112 [Psychrobacter glaciei]|jgi:hypothetical protein
MPSEARFLTAILPILTENERLTIMICGFAILCITIAHINDRFVILKRI